MPVISLLFGGGIRELIKELPGSNMTLGMNRKLTEEEEEMHSKA